MRKYSVALLLAILPCVIPRLAHPIPKFNFNDFNVYYTAALLAREHRGAAIYGGADDGTDPQLKWAQLDTPIATAGREAGVEKIMLYVYPPILADLLIPLSFLPLVPAHIVWTCLNALSILLIAVILARLLKVKFFTPQSFALLMALALSTPALYSLTWGQVTLLLTLCWVSGIYAYVKGWQASSAFAFALASAIKLTPLLVLVPFVMWKEWKWLRSFTIWIVLLGLTASAISSPYAIRDFFLHVLPSMSRGILRVDNRSIVAATQFFYVALHGSNNSPVEGAVPDSIVMLGKFISLMALLLTVVFPLYRYRRDMTLNDRVIALALVGMVSVALAPVSWVHAYVMCYPALALLWGEAFTRRISNPKLVMLTGCSIILTSVLMKDVTSALAETGSHLLLASLMMFVTPLAALLLAYLRFLDMSREQGQRLIAVPQ